MSVAPRRAAAYPPNELFLFTFSFYFLAQIDHVFTKAVCSDTSMEGRMGECCAGPPPLCEVLIHTKRGNRAIELGPRPYFPPPKPRASFRPGILAKRPRGLNPQTSQNSIKAKFAEFGLCEVRILGILGSSPQLQRIAMTLSRVHAT